MIELELKYRLKNEPNTLNKINVNKTKTQSDIYYDTEDFSLIKGGNFLRVRNGKRLEFKLGTIDTTHLFCEEKNFELEEFKIKQNDIINILNAIGLKNVNCSETLEEFLTLNGLKVLAPIEKERKEYKLEDGITVALDSVDNLGLFVEAEIMIDADSLTEAEAAAAKKRLEEKLGKLNILNDEAEEVKVGYVELYLLEHNKKAYGAGIFKI